MVSIRCKTAVREELKHLGFHFIVDMGVVEIMENITIEQRDILRIGLSTSGLELMDDKKALLIEKMKKEIVEMIYYGDELPKQNFSDYLSSKLGCDYTYMANLFSEAQGSTVEKFIISHKIERAKELLIYGELNLTEIAWKLQYSSVAHLSNQFKKVTGLTPSHFKLLKIKRQKSIVDALEGADTVI
jgi:AraC-like DNA-binding protein